MLKDHFVLMVIWSGLTSLFFALLMRTGRKPVLKLFFILLGCLLGFSIGLGWIMYPFPS